MHWVIRPQKNVAYHFLYCERWIWKRNPEDGTMLLLAQTWHAPSTN